MAIVVEGRHVQVIQADPLPGWSIEQYAVSWWYGKLSRPGYSSKGGGHKDVLPVQ